MKETPLTRKELVRFAEDSDLDKALTDLMTLRKKYEEEIPFISIKIQQLMAASSTSVVITKKISSLPSDVKLYHQIGRMFTFISTNDAKSMLEERGVVYSETIKKLEDEKNKLNNNVEAADKHARELVEKARQKLNTTLVN